MKKILTAAVAVVAIVLLAPAVQGRTTYEAPPVDDDGLVHRGAVIRLGPSVYIHANSTHAAVGIRSLTWADNRCDIVVTTDFQPGERVIAAIAEEDESMARLNVQAGVSGGGEYATIRMYRAGHHICANDPVFGTVSNIWLEIISLRPTS